MESVMLTPPDMYARYVQSYPEKQSMADEFIRLGLADHPDFIRLIETSIADPIDQIAKDRAALFADRLLSNARHFDGRLGGGVIAGQRCGVQSCDHDGANVYAEIKGSISYVRLDRPNKSVLKPHYTNPAYEFAQLHFDAFEQLCVQAEQQRNTLAVRPTKHKRTPSNGM